MAITFQTDGSAGSGTTDANISLAVTAGDLIFVLINSNSTAGTLSISDGVNTYTPCLAQFKDAGSNCIVRAWTAIAATTTTLTVDCHNTSSVNWMGAVGLTFRSTAGWPASPADQVTTASVSATTTPTATTTGTTAQNNEVVLGCLGVLHVVGNTITAGTGYTASTNGILHFSGVDTGVEYQIVTSTGTFAPAFGATSAVSGAVLAITLKDNSGGGVTHGLFMSSEPLSGLGGGGPFFKNPIG